MTWPIYPGETDAPPLVQHAQAQLAPIGGPDTYCAAVDVWRDGTHLWRSYGLTEGSETVYEWTDREMGRDVAQNYDEGLWRIPFAVTADYPVPLESAMAPVGGAKALRNLLMAVVAIARWPFPPVFEDVITAEGLWMKLHRAQRDYTVYTCVVEAPPIPEGPGTIVVRMMYCKRDVAINETLKGTRWRATLEPRPTRAGVDDPGLVCGTIEFEAAADDPAQILRSAKAVFNITGWPAQRLAGSNVWHLTRAPYRLTIEAVKQAESAASQADTSEGGQP